MMTLNREALLALRERTGYTKAELARRAGLSPALIHRLENGTRDGTPSSMRKLADALNVPLHALMGPNDEVAA